MFEINETKKTTKEFDAGVTFVLEVVREYLPYVFYEHIVKKVAEKRQQQSQSEV